MAIDEKAEALFDASSKFQILPNTQKKLKMGSVAFVNEFTFLFFFSQKSEDILVNY